jgi:hypothetical protein
MAWQHAFSFGSVFGTEKGDDAMTPMHDQAANLLMTIWRGIGADYKSRYRMSIWQQFEDRVRSAAYTSSLGRFISTLCLSLNATVGIKAEDRNVADRILNGGNDQALLKLLRDETTLIVLMVRIANQERREKWEAEHLLTEEDG